MKKTSLNKKILVIGSTGFLGQSLFATLEAKGVDVYGTIRKKNTGLKKRLVLDLESETNVKDFHWKDFDIIADCSGHINYNGTLESELQNIKSNLLIPLYIISRLSKKQKYFYCSTHAVLLPNETQNPYSLSKRMFEDCIHVADRNLSQVTIFRLPGLFGQSRITGLLHLIKENFLTKKALKLDLSSQKWHTMYLPRAVDIMIAIMSNKHAPRLVTIGYPLQTSIEKIIKIAESMFGYKVPIMIKKGKIDRYVPDTRVQKLFYSINLFDFEKDLREYFKMLRV